MSTTGAPEVPTPDSSGRRRFPRALLGQVAALSLPRPSAVSLDVTATAADLPAAVADALAWCRVLGGARDIRVLHRASRGAAALALLDVDGVTAALSVSTVSSGSGVLRGTSLGPTRTEVEIDLDAGIASARITDEQGERRLPTVWSLRAGATSIDHSGDDRRLAGTILGDPSRP